MKYLAITLVALFVAITGSSIQEIFLTPLEALQLSFPLWIKLVPIIYSIIITIIMVFSVKENQIKRIGILVIIAIIYIILVDVTLIRKVDSIKLSHPLKVEEIVFIKSKLGLKVIQQTSSSGAKLFFIRTLENRRLLEENLNQIPKGISK